MSDPRDNRKPAAASPKSGDLDRDARLGAALRQNLRRRKAQRDARREAGGDEEIRPRVADDMDS